jgi:hypothetical protein
MRISRIEDFCFQQRAKYMDIPKNDLDTGSSDVIDYCANEECGAEIHIGQSVLKIGHDLVCSGACLIKKLGAVTVIAGKGVNPKDGRTAMAEA